MTKKEFIQLMIDFIGIQKSEDKLNKAWQEFEPNFNYLSFGRYTELFLNTIRKAMNDESDWIGYWVYELDFGKKATNESVQDKDGKYLPCKTLSDLYNLITKK